MFFMITGNKRGKAVLPWYFWMDGKSRILIVSFLGRIGQVASKESTERQVVIHYLMGWNGAVKGPASSVHWQRQHLVILGTHLTTTLTNGS
jgi:hypothetical protein